VRRSQAGSSSQAPEEVIIMFSDWQLLPAPTANPDTEPERWPVLLRLLAEAERTEEANRREVIPDQSRPGRPVPRPFAHD
jgi:hypothetical protein